MACMSEDTSIALQRYLEAEVQRRNVSDPITPADFLKMLLARADTRVRPYINRDYLNRIAGVAYERYIARSVAGDAPAMIIVPAPLSKRQMAELLGDGRNYVMVFGAESIYFQDTVHALAIDSQYENNVNILGVHKDWLSPGGAQRAIILDKDGLVKEVAFEEPVPIHIVQILHLPLKGERQLHRELSRRFHDGGIPQINPYPHSAERADDKAQTHDLWKQCEHEIVSPKYTLIPRGSSPEEIAKHLRTFMGNGQLLDVVIQPNRGTEGYRVEKFSTGTDIRPALFYIKDQVLPQDDAIVREMRGNVRYTDRSSGSSLNVTFRVNVAWNGSEFVAESGYAQVARDEETFPASRGKGGIIVDINEALADLYCPRYGRFIPVNEDIAAMKKAAENAARALNAGLDAEDYLKHIGIDILLEVTESGAGVIPVVLEANPRPAGLSHSSEILGISRTKPRQRISTEIFKLVRTL